MEEASTELRRRLFPYIVPRSWVDAVGADKLIMWPMTDDVCMVLVVEGQAAVRNVRFQDLLDAALSPEEAFEVAADNLGRAWQDGAFQFGIAELRDGTLVGMARGNWMAPAGALLLGNFYQENCLRLGHTEFAAVAVNQQCLFAFPTDEKTLASAALRAALDDESAGTPKPISRSWLKLDGGWPGPHPLSGLF